MPRPRAVAVRRAPSLSCGLKMWLGITLANSVGSRSEGCATPCSKSATPWSNPLPSHPFPSHSQLPWPDEHHPQHTFFHPNRLPSTTIIVVPMLRVATSVTPNGPAVAAEATNLASTGQTFNLVASPATIDRQFGSLSMMPTKIGSEVGWGEK